MMAQGIQNVCGGCQKRIEAWSDGNPYYLNALGRKQYAYHPDHEGLERCIGNDVPHLCLSCGKGFRVDSRAPITTCPHCKSAEIVDAYELGGRRCPYCKTGTFATDPNYFAIS